MNNIEKFDGRKDIRAWLFVIAKNTYFSYCRRKRHDADWTEYENIVDVGVHFAENLVNEEKAFLRIYSELSFEQIGKCYQKSAGWARVTYHRARQMIRAQISQEEK